MKPVTVSEKDQLPDINRYTSAQEQRPYMIETDEKRGVGIRRTSQGNRTYLEAKRDFVAPGTHHMGMRNQLNNFNSNLTASSEYHNRNISTRQETLACDNAAEQMTDVHPSSFGVPLPLNQLNSNFNREPAHTSIVSQESMTSRNGG